ncbi:MAG TPA: glycosyltransferase family 2 protein [Elusimicrobia bacterium]|nr:glycosyltransferase family 2 protein [Elusimicrobiota bacterium]HBT61926.1 glycosyltransferase family 2 protein [Elusimicrobiota bacterium]
MGQGQTLSIVIPAFNEEAAASDIVRRCLEAREVICRDTGLERVEVVVVDDGSRDRTREIVASFPEARLVVHPVNRGYGAALMTGFAAASGELLGFLDADGTCDPLAFVELYGALARGADMAVGNRLHGGSRMPALRRMGNSFYALVISSLTGVAVTDSASGMRLFRRELLRRLSPLPAGLHFTPAMTARAAALGARIAERDIPYAERRGRSKLNVAADGVRFLRVILGMVFAIYPLRIFGPIGAFFGCLALGYGVEPILYYAARGKLEEFMIYRLLTIVTLACCGLAALCFGCLAQSLSDAMTGRRTRWLSWTYMPEAAAGLGGLLGLGGVLLNSRTVVEYVTSGRITIHWVYVLTGGLAVIFGTMLGCFGITLALVRHLPGGDGRQARKL